MGRGTINAVWGKTPNVIEQRLLVALYEAQQPMTHSEILVLAEKLGLLNVSMNLLALSDKGLVATDRNNKHSLTPAGWALTKVGVDYQLFATPHEMARPTAVIDIPADPVKQADAKQAAAKPMTLRAELARDVEHDLRHRGADKGTPDDKPPQEERHKLHEGTFGSPPDTQRPATPTPGPRLVANGGSVVVTPIRAVAAAPKQAPAPTPSPPPPQPAPVVTTAPAPVAEQPKPKPVAVSTPKPAAKPPMPPMRRPPPPPGSRR